MTEWGEYAGVVVLVMKENGYINATKLCINNNKRIESWLVNGSSKVMIKETAAETRLQEDNIVIKRGRCVYVHRYLMPSILLWISPTNAFKISNYVDKISLNIIRSQYFETNDKANKYLRVRRTNIQRTRSYTLNDIIDMVKPVLVLENLGQKLVLDKPCGVYLLFNNKTDEYYVGSSKNLASRVSCYLRDSYTKKTVKHRDLIRDAISKYTDSAFSLLIVELTEKYLEREKHYIEMLDPPYNVDLYESLVDDIAKLSLSS
jgi:hypothetical protein